jgi:uncharacterized protein (TIGR03435 family)
MLRCNYMGWMILLSANVAVGQNTVVFPTFEAASVKAVDGSRGGLGALSGGPGTNSPGQLAGVATVKLLLMRAYDLKDYQIVGPAWIGSYRFQIQAKIPGGAEKAQVGPMLQSLLAERFGLVAHHETRQLAAYELTVAKTGPKLMSSKAVSGLTKEAAGPSTNPRFVKGAEGFPELAPGADVSRTYFVVFSGSDGLLYKMWGRHETMQQLADRITPQLDRPVVDVTKLQGEYDFTLAWAVESLGGVVPRNGSPPDEIDSANTPVLSAFSPSIFDALERQLGLRLQQKKRPVAVLVVDRVNAKPTED